MTLPVNIMIRDNLYDDLSTKSVEEIEKIGCKEIFNNFERRMLSNQEMNRLTSEQYIAVIEKIDAYKQLLEQQGAARKYASKRLAQEHQKIVIVWSKLIDLILAKP